MTHHSIIISGKNTFTEWGLIPTSRPVVNPPEVKTNYVELPAADGILDYSELLTGKVLYGQRRGSWEFRVLRGRNWFSVYNGILNFLHGLRCEVVLEDDPQFMYTGRLSVNAWKSEPGYSTVTLDYDLDPFRQSVTGSNDGDWLWDDPFDRVILYGTFSVSGQKYRNLINTGVRSVIPTVCCSSAMTVSFNDRMFDLVSGENYNMDLVLAPGDNEMCFTGNGTVTVSYRGESL